jgi:hypothetical protein
MKLNRSVLVAVMIIGSTVAVAGCNTSGAADEGAEQGSVQQESGSTLAAVASEAHRFGGGFGHGRRAEVRERRGEHRREEHREHAREERRERGWFGGLRRWWR